MLLYKGWLETRERLLVALGWAGFGLLPWVPEYNLSRATVLTGLIAIILAGAGIATQVSLRASNDVHGSMCFTLALPVSRLRLFAVRAGLGWLEMIAAIGTWYCGIWILYPKAITTAAATLESAAIVVIGASALYSITLLFATFLQDQWRAWASGAVFTALWWLSNHTPFLASANMFRAMGEGILPTGQTAPWTEMAFSLELTAILFFASVKVVQLREY